MLGMQRWKKQAEGLDTLEKYITIVDWQRKVLNLKQLGYLPAMYWIINLETNKFDWINSPDYKLIKSGVDLDNIITLDEFLEVGFENMIEYIETKKQQKNIISERDFVENNNL